MPIRSLSLSRFSRQNRNSATQFHNAASLIHQCTSHHHAVARYGGSQSTPRSTPHGGTTRPSRPLIAHFTSLCCAWHHALELLALFVPLSLLLAVSWAVCDHALQEWKKAAGAMIEGRRALALICTATAPSQCAYSPSPTNKTKSAAAARVPAHSTLGVDVHVLDPASPSH